MSSVRGGGHLLDLDLAAGRLLPLKDFRCSTTVYELCRKVTNIEKLYLIVLLH